MAGWLPLFAPEITFPSTFLGNPNVTITAINTSGGIVTSRDSDGSTYQTPFFIQTSASAITATGTSAPYEDLEYQWKVSGPDAGDNFTRPTDGVSVNSFLNQTGPEAAFCMRTAGTYTIRLIVRGKNGGAYTTATVTKQVIVNAFATGANEIWFDQAGGNDSNPGSLASPKQSISAINAAIASGKAIHLKRGSNWAGSDGIVFPEGFVDISGVRIDAYGSGPNPIINTTSGSSFPIKINTGSQSSTSSKLDIVVQNIDFLNSGARNIAALSLGVGDNAYFVENIYFDNCNFEVSHDNHDFSFPTTTLSAGLSLTQDQAYNWGFWKCNITNPLNSTHLTMAMQGSAKYWHFHIGGTPSGAGTDQQGDHHLYNDTKDHSLYRWIDFGQTGTGSGKRNFCINVNWDADPPNSGEANVETAHYNHYAENSLRYTTFGIDMGNRTNNTNTLDSTVFFQYAVIEANAFNITGGLLFGCGQSVTVRHNRAWGDTQEAFFYSPSVVGQTTTGTQKTHLISRVYGNKIYIPSASASDAIINYPQSGWTQPQYVTDNILVDARSASILTNIVSTDQASAGSVIDRNTYYSTTGDTTLFVDNGGSPISFASWTALSSNRWDQNSSLLGSNTLGWTLPVTQWSHMN